MNKFDVQVVGEGWHGPTKIQVRIAREHGGVSVHVKSPKDEWCIAYIQDDGVVRYSEKNVRDIGFVSEILRG